MSVLPFPDLEPPSSVAAVIDLYLRHTRHEQSARTYRERKAILDAFGASYGTLALEAAKPFHLRLWIDGHPRWRSGWTKRRVAGTVLRAFNWARKIGLAAANPFDGVAYPPGDRGQPMSERDYRALLRATDPPLRRALLFLRRSGARPGELSALRPEHLQLERGLAVLDQHKTRRRTGRARRIYLDDVLVALLRWLAARTEPGQPLFRNSRGRAWNRTSLALRISRLRRRCGVEARVKLYGLRHAFVTQGILRDVPIATLAELAGHQSTKTTEIYVHLAGQDRHLRSGLLRIFGAT